MKLGRVGVVGLALVVGSGCHFGTDLENAPLVVDILDTKTEPPAKVTVTFQVSGQDGSPTCR